MLCLSLVCCFFTSACQKLTLRSHWIKFTCLILVILSNRVLGREEKELKRNKILTHDTSVTTYSTGLLLWCFWHLKKSSKREVNRGGGGGSRRWYTGRYAGAPARPRKESLNQGCQRRKESPTPTQYPGSGSWPRPSWSTLGTLPARVRPPALHQFYFLDLGLGLNKVRKPRARARAPASVQMPKMLD